MKNQGCIKKVRHNARQQVREAWEAGHRRSVEGVGSANGWLKNGYAGMNERIFFCPSILH